MPESSRETSQLQSSGIRRLFQHSAIYSVSTSIQRLQGLIMTPIYTSTIYLPQLSDYSNYGLVYTFIAFMNFVYLYGMDSAFLRYFFLGKTDRRTVFSTTFFMLTITGLATTVFIVIFSKPISRYVLFAPELSHFIKLAGFILILDTLGNLPFLILRAEEKPAKFTFFRMIRFLLELVLNLIFVVVLRKGVFGILYANIIAASVNLLIMSPYALKYLSGKFNLSLLKEMVKFGLPFLPNGIAFMTIEMVDRFLVTRYLGKEVLAFYHANYKFAAVLLLLIVGFRNAWQPFFLKIARDTQAASTYSKILNYFLLLAGTISIFITFFIEDVLTVKYFDAFYILGRNYWNGIDFIPFIVLSYLFYGIYTIFTPAFYITKKSPYMVIFTGSGALINIAVNLILLPAIGIWGAVTATVLAYFVMAFSIYVVAQKLYPIPLNIGKILTIFILIGLAYFLHYFLNLGLLWEIIFFICYLAIIWIKWLSPAEISQLRLFIAESIGVKHGEKQKK